MDSQCFVVRSFLMMFRYKWTDHENRSTSPEKGDESMYRIWLMNEMINCFHERGRVEGQYSQSNRCLGLVSLLRMLTADPLTGEVRKAKATRARTIRANSRSKWFIYLKIFLTHCSRNHNEIFWIGQLRFKRKCCERFYSELTAADTWNLPWKRWGETVYVSI